MAVKVLGQANPAATTVTTLYTVPSGKAAVCSTLAVCNQDAASIFYRLMVRPGGAALIVAHYLVYDAALPAASSDFLTIGITLAAGDVVSVRASNPNVSFSLFGDES